LSLSVRAADEHHTAGVTAAQVESRVAALRAAQARLSRRSFDSVIAALEATVDTWLDPSSEWRREAERVLPLATGSSPEMVRFALPWMIEPLRSPALENLLDAELGDRRALDASAEGGLASVPSVILHVLAGNLPALAVVPITLTLAIKSSALVKAARGDRVTPSLFVRSLAAVDAELSECVATVYWPGGDRGVEESALSIVDLAVASGDDRTLADLRSRCTARFIGHGHRVSFAVVAAEVLHSSELARSAAAGLAVDVSVWDQRGCLSPQLCFVEGGFNDACNFAQLVARELATLACQLPPAEKNIAEQIAVRQFRDQADWARFSGEPSMVLAPERSTDWTIVVEHEPAFRPTPLCRSLRVLPIEDLADLRDVLAPVRRLLEGAGRAAPPERIAQLDTLLCGAGVHLIAPLGAMQRPPLSWKQGGRARVGDWITWRRKR